MFKQTIALITILSFSPLLPYSRSLCVAQQAPDVARAATLKDLGFIEGKWRGRVGAAIAEEHWTSAEGDNIIGMFRFVEGGKAIFFELLTIEQSGEGPVLRIKHFKPGLIGWEEKNDAVTFALTEVKTDYAKFEMADRKTSLTFIRDKERLTVQLAKIKDGQAKVDEFKYELIK